MANVKIVLNKAGVRSLLCSNEAQSICEEYAGRAVQRLGEGYETEKRSYPERKGAAILPVTYQAKKDTLKNNSILKAMR